MIEGNLVRRLLERDSEFKKVYERHRDCEKKVAKLGKRVYLTQDEETERKRLQKLKLLQKDRMEEIILRQRGKGPRG